VPPSAIHVRYFNSARWCVDAGDRAHPVSEHIGLNAAESAANALAERLGVIEVVVHDAYGRCHTHRFRRNYDPSR
jgi:hypothetical protein